MPHGGIITAHEKIRREHELLRFARNDQGHHAASLW
jgi:hypothetical protein